MRMLVWTVRDSRSARRHQRHANADVCPLHTPQLYSQDTIGRVGLDPCSAHGLVAQAGSERELLVLRPWEPASHAPRHHNRTTTPRPVDALDSQHEVFGHVHIMPRHASAAVPRSTPGQPCPAGLEPSHNSFVVRSALQ